MVSREQTAIVVFKLEAQNFKSVCDKLKQIAVSHPKFKQVQCAKGQNEFECAFEDANDPESTISITFFAADYVIR